MLLVFFVCPALGYSQDISEKILEMRKKFMAGQALSKEELKLQKKLVDGQDVSMIQLISDPKQYHNRLVGITGFVNLEFEGNAVYFSQDDYKYGISKNALWIEATEDMKQNPQNYSQKYCYMFGTFDGKSKGHMSSFNGTIKDVLRIECWDSDKAREPSKK